MFTGDRLTRQPGEDLCDPVCTFGEIGRDEIVLALLGDSAMLICNIRWRASEVGDEIANHLQTGKVVSSLPRCQQPFSRINKFLMLQQRYRSRVV